MKAASQFWVSFARSNDASGVGISGNFTVAKTPGTLDIDVPLSAFGLPSPQTLHATATATATNTVAYQADTRFSPAIDLLGDGSVELSRLQGTFTLATYPIPPGEQAPCGDCGGTYFSIEGGSLTATTQLGATTISIDRAVGVTGASRALLTTTAGPPQGVAWSGVYDLPVCSTGIASSTQLEVALDRPAPSSGARISARITSGTGVSTPSELSLEPGRDSVIVPLTIAANASGSSTLTLASGGVAQTVSLSIHAAGSCVAPSSKLALSPLVDPHVCTACSTFAAANASGDRIVSVNGVIDLLHAGALASVKAMFTGATGVSAVSINNTGWATGIVTVGGISQAYRADLLHGAHQPQYLGYMTPTAITQSGMVIGFRTDSFTGHTFAVMNRGNGIVDLHLAYAGGVLQSRALYATGGYATGTFVDNAGASHGFLLEGGTFVMLPPVGTTAPTPVGISSIGTVLYNAGTNVSPIAMTLTAAGVSTRILAPSGYVSFAPTGINRWGTVVGNATTSAGASRAFAWRPGTGFTALSGYVAGLAVADLALAITDNNTIVVHGTASLGLRASPGDLYTITL
ncbi:MAG TPA: hypothetical protein VGM88_33405 [Kofleriaceae bacterium]